MHMELIIAEEAYLEGSKAYFSSHIYLKPKQWDKKKTCTKVPPHTESLNQMRWEFLVKLETKELDLWQNGHKASLQRLKE